jgi:hypothetical protein
MNRDELYLLRLDLNSAWMMAFQEIENLKRFRKQVKSMCDRIDEMMEKENGEEN